MNYKSFFILIPFICFSCLLSCRKFLDVVPNNGVAIPQSVSELQALLDNTGVMNLQSSPGFGESSSDDYYLTLTDYNSLETERQKIYTWERGDYNFNNDWSVGYRAIYYSNYCLDQIVKIEKSGSNKDAWNNVYGSSLFYRSYNFLNLLWAFAKAFDEATAGAEKGIVLRLNSDFNIPSKRASVKDGYQQVLSDTKEAIEYLPDLPDNVMRPSKAAAYGLLARAYLSMRNYDSAFKYADKALSLKSGLMNFNNDPDLSINLEVPFKKFNKEIIFYTEMTTFDAIHLYVYSEVDTALYASYKGEDLRKTAFFRKVSNNFKFKGSYSGALQNFSGLATDELYLIKAECEARLSDANAAMATLNLLLQSRWSNQKAYVAVTADSPQNALTKVLEERRRELLYRGLRWPDIKRFNLEGAGMVLTRKVGEQIFTLLPNSPYYALPLPADIIREAGIEQN